MLLWRVQVFQRLGIMFRLLRPVNPRDTALRGSEAAYNPNLWQRILCVRGSPEAPCMRAFCMLHLRVACVRHTRHSA